ncbi:MAG: hypothetical protein U1F46_10210 [Marinagarivorans sp.]
MENMVVFNMAVAEVFGKCFLNFPVKIKIDSNEIALQIASTRPDNEILETDTPLPTEIVSASINWLIEAGYLWSQGSTDDLEFYDVVLTPKGLETLKATPQSLLKKESFGAIFAGGIKKVGAEAAIETVKMVLALGANHLS